jgi:hypothetical protein
VKDAFYSSTIALLELSNVKLVFFPKNTTAGIQPLSRLMQVSLRTSNIIIKHLLDYLFNEDDDADAAKKITVSLNGSREVGIIWSRMRP